MQWDRELRSLKGLRRLPLQDRGGGTEAPPRAGSKVGAETSTLSAQETGAIPLLRPGGAPGLSVEALGARTPGSAKHFAQAHEVFNALWVAVPPSW